MAKTVNIHEAKTHLSRLVRRAQSGEEIIIARGGKPVARLLGVESVASIDAGILGDPNMNLIVGDRRIANLDLFEILGVSRAKHQGKEYKYKFIRHNRLCRRKTPGNQTQGDKRIGSVGERGFISLGASISHTSLGFEGL